MKIFSITTAFPRSKSDVLIPWIIKLIHLLKKKEINTEIFTSTYRGMKSGSYEEIEVTRFRYFFKGLEKLSHDMSIPEKSSSSNPPTRLKASFSTSIVTKQSHILA